MDLSDIDAQIRALQQEQTKLRLSSGPVGWRRQDHKGRWVLIDTDGSDEARLRAFGCEPVFAERRRMADGAATKLAKQHRGAALIRAVEAWHCIN